MKIKSKYDKALKKYHIYYDKIKDKKALRYTYINQINQRSDMLIIIETHLGSISEPDPLEYTRSLERVLQDEGIKYIVQPIEARVQKNILGIFGGNKKPIKDFSISFYLNQGSLTEDFFDKVLCEFDLQIGYNLLKDQSTLFEDISKGYFDTRDTSAYYGEALFDSMIFHKFLASEDLPQL